MSEVQSMIAAKPQPSDQEMIKSLTQKGYTVHRSGKQVFG